MRAPARSFQRLLALAVVAACAALTGAAPATAAPAAHPAARPAFTAGRTAYVDVAVATMWTEPGHDRPIDAPAVGNPVDPRAWMASMTLSQRLYLVDYLETQAPLGTAVTVLGTQDGWVHVAVHGQPTPRNALGYPGWVPAGQLTADPAFAHLTGRPFAAVTTATAWLYSDQRRTHRVMELGLDTRLPVLARAGGSVLVAVPHGVPAWLPATGTAVYRDAAAIPAPTGRDLVTTAKLFVGLPYLFGGTSAFGFDCSGFTHTVYDLHGVTIPRDADAQYAAGTPVPADQLQPGDLLFYAYPGNGYVHHVGMYTGDGYEIDAPINSATVESGVEIVKVAEHRYADQYVGARRFV
jgi:cell wall-associated NlpC family hydrolase